MDLIVLPGSVIGFWQMLKTKNRINLLKINIKTKSFQPSKQRISFVVCFILLQPCTYLD